MGLKDRLQQVQHSNGMEDPRAKIEKARQEDQLRKEEERKIKEMERKAEKNVLRFIREINYTMAGKKGETKVVATTDIGSVHVEWGRKTLRTGSPLSLEGIVQAHHIGLTIDRDNNVGITYGKQDVKAIPQEIVTNTGNRNWKSLVEDKIVEIVQSRSDVWTQDITLDASWD